MTRTCGGAGVEAAREHPDWVVGFEDEVWWSRFAQPRLHTWAEDGQALHWVEQVKVKSDLAPKALACYGVWLRWWLPNQPAQEKALLRFVEGRPVSALSTQYLEWVCQQVARLGHKVWVLVWDNASWHISQAVRAWVQAHNRQVKQAGLGVRILLCYLPIKSPWLNPIEPKWMHGKRKILEPDRTLSAQELAERVCAVFECVHEPHLALSQYAS